MKFLATKNGMTNNFYSPLSFVPVFGSRMRDPGSGMGKNQDPGSGINIPDPQHCPGGSLDHGSQIRITLMRSSMWIRIKVESWIRIRIKMERWIRIRITVKSWIRIRITVCDADPQP